MSQTYPPEGAAASEGVRNQLGRPSLDPLAVLARETAQNSLDAASTDTVRFGLSFRRLTDVEAWRNVLLPGPTGGGLHIEEVLDAEPLIIVISDRGTTGLGGPLRADAVWEGPRDFVAFMRNTGEPPDKAHGGGTFGFGKSILYTTSRAGAVLVRTRCHWDGRPQSRLMAIGLGPSYSDGRHNYTGRHWWGEPQEDGVVDPVLDDRADEVADVLGLPSVGDELGTDLVVLAPRLGEVDGRARSLQEAAEYAASACLWYLWPKMVGGDGRVRLDLSVDVDGVAVELPDPERVGPLRSFVAAYRALTGAEAEELYCLSPRRLLGRFAMTQGFAAPPTGSSSIFDLAAPFSGNAHHVARMRQAALVVDYLEQRRLPGDILEYGGVFQVDSEVDDVFARAEPPTHDAWIDSQLTGRERSYVRTHVVRIKERIDRVVNPPVSSGDAGVVLPLGAASTALGSLVAGAAAVEAGSRAPAHLAGGRSGAGRSGGGATRRRSRGRGAAVVVGDPAFTTHDGAPALRVPVDVKGPLDARVVLAASVAVAVAADGGHEREPPRGAAGPVVVGWEDVDGGTWVPGRELHIDEACPRTWRLVVRPIRGTGTSIAVEAVAS